MNKQQIKTEIDSIINFTKDRSYYAPDQLTEISERLEKLRSEI